MIVFPNKKTDGVQVPDTLITINNSKDYKVLDAPNIDWDAYQMDWPKSVYKFSSGERVSDDPESRQNNAIDWYTPGAKFHNSDELPSWKNGLINDSEQVIDMIDYLMWRVANLDYFCDHWNLRDSKKVTLNLVCDKTENYTYWINETSAFEYTGSWYNCMDLISGRPIYQTGLSDGNFYNNHYLKVNSSNSDFNLTLQPSKDNSSYTLLRQTGYDKLDSFIQNYNYFGNQYVVFSDSNGSISIEVTSGTASIEVPENLTPTSANNENTSFVADIDIMVYGTTNYFYPSKSFIPALYDNVLSLEDDNWKKHSTDYFLDPCFNETTGSSQPVTCTMSIKQAPSTVNGVQFGEGLLNLNLNISKVQISCSFGINGNVNASGMAIPFYNDILESNDYDIIFDIEENDYNISTIDDLIDYGLYPFFFITGEDGSRDTSYRLNIGDDNVFNSFSSDLYGTISANGNTFTYTPPEEENSYDKNIKIYCFLYYKDGNNNDILPRCRAFEPSMLEFDLTLTAEKNNRIVFLDNDSMPGELLRWNDVEKKYQKSNFLVNIQGKNPDGTLDSRSVFIDKTQIHYAGINGEPSNIVDYAVKDIVIGDPEYGITESLIINEVNKDIATSLYSDDVKVEFYGLAKQNSLIDREFDFNNGFIKLKGVNMDALKIKMDSEDFIGETDTGEAIPFKYILDDKPTNYTLYSEDGYLDRNENEIRQLNIDTDFNTVKSSNFKSVNITNTDFIPQDLNVEIKTSYGTDSDNPKICMIGEENGKYTGFVINGSSAMFPKSNGLISSSNCVDNTTTYDSERNEISYNDTIYDADNDYFYYVFRIYCDAGSDVEGGGSVYSAAEAYYFLRVLRNKKEFMLSFRDFTFDNNSVMYDFNGNTYENRSLTRSIIYLNRMLSEQSIANNSDIHGKQWWYIYGTHENDTTILNERTLVMNDSYEYRDSNDNTIKKKEKTEDFIRIYNEGEKISVKRDYSSKEINPLNKLSNTENNWRYDPSGTEISVGKCYTTDSGIDYSGAILYVNKLKRKINLYGNYVDENSTTDDIFEYVNNTNFQEIPIGIVIGNSDRYERITANTSGKLNVYKKKYDFELATTRSESNNNLRTLVSTYSNPKSVKNATSLLDDDVIGYDEYISRINSEYSYPIYFCSQEFSSNNSPDLLEAEDKIKIGSGGKILTEIYGTRPAIELETNNSSSWLIDDSNGQTSIMPTDDPIQLYHYIYYDEKGNATQLYGLIQLFGFETNSTPSKVSFKVHEDGNGIYAEKKFECYFTVTD